MTCTRTDVPRDFGKRLSPELLYRMRSECQQLIAVAFWMGDSRAEEAFAQCFTPDGVSDHDGGLGSPLLAWCQGDVLLDRTSTPFAGSIRLGSTRSQGGALDRQSHYDSQCSVWRQR